jgi:threonine/homoserine/homoserine lactone efflux protein
MPIHDLWLFVVSGILLNITPGPDMALVISRSTAHGMRSGIAAAVGVGAGTFVHIAAATLGISAVLMASAWGFTAIKWLGALYLIWIGARMVWTAARVSPSASSAGNIGYSGPAVGSTEAFWQGFLTNVFNPKVAMFFLAFLPQFIDGTAPGTAVAFVFLGLIFTCTGTIWNVLVANAAGRAGQSRAFGRFSHWLEGGIGLLFMGLGIKLALADRL